MLWLQGPHLTWTTDKHGIDITSVKLIHIFSYGCILTFLKPVSFKVEIGCTGRARRGFPHPPKTTAAIFVETIENFNILHASFPNAELMDSPSVFHPSPSSAECAVYSVEPST
jgi:hypothetical protein